MAVSETFTFDLTPQQASALQTEITNELGWNAGLGVTRGEYFHNQTILWWRDLIRRNRNKVARTASEAQNAMDVANIPIT